MSPFWQNVNEELQYQGMNYKTLSFLTGIPYTTLTNGKNRQDSIPSADVAVKIARVLNKPLERLLGEDGEISNSENQLNDKDEQMHITHLYKKYKNLINSLEKCNTSVQDSFIRMAETVSKQLEK